MAFLSACSGIEMVAPQQNIGFQYLIDAHFIWNYNGLGESCNSGNNKGKYGKQVAIIYRKMIELR